MAQNEETPDSATIRLARLSKGERECLELVNQELGSKEIARRLDVSPHTVDARIKSATSKLGTKSRFVAAKMLADLTRCTSDVTVTSAHTNLVYELLDLPSSAATDNKRPSAGEGDGPADLEQARPLKPESQRDSGRGEPWPERPFSIATIFEDENKLSIGRRFLVIVIGAIAIAIAVGAIVNGLIGISRVLASS
jgi:DNA-binding CsgD family transcriptional regulator